MSEQAQVNVAGSIIGKLILSAFPVGLAGWALVSAIERYQEIAASPDLNGDGHFSILDVPGAIISMLLEVGHRYQALFAKSKFGPFLEMSADAPNVLWSIVFAGFAYFMIFSLFAVWARDEE